MQILPDNTISQFKSTNKSFKPAVQCHPDLRPNFDHQLIASPSQSCSNALIMAGADLAAKNDGQESAINFLLRHHPGCVDTIEDKLDEGINVKWDKNSKYKKVEMDFGVFRCSQSLGLSETF